MATITVKPWERGDTGFRNVSLAKLFQAKGKMSLSLAKQSVDDLIDGRAVLIEIDSIDEARDFAEEIRRLGAICEVKF